MPLATQRCHLVMLSQQSPRPQLGAGTTLPLFLCPLSWWPWGRAHVQPLATGLEA